MERSEAEERRCCRCGPVVGFGPRPARVSARIDRAGLSRHEVTYWLDAAETRGGSAYACACLLALNGLRVGELCAAIVDGLGQSTWHRTLTLRAEITKGGKAAVIALAPRTVLAISLVRDERRSGALLRNQHGRRMTSYNVAYLVKALCRQIGVDRRITPHKFAALGDHAGPRRRHRAARRAG